MWGAGACQSEVGNEPGSVNHLWLLIPRGKLHTEPSECNEGEKQQTAFPPRWWWAIKLCLDGCSKWSIDVRVFSCALSICGYPLVACGRHCVQVEGEDAGQRFEYSRDAR
jgi:hypothetical protein